MDDCQAENTGTGEVQAAGQDLPRDASTQTSEIPSESTAVSQISGDCPETGKCPASDETLAETKPAEAHILGSERQSETTHTGEESESTLIDTSAIQPLDQDAAAPTLTTIPPSPTDAERTESPGDDRDAPEADRRPMAGGEGATEESTLTPPSPSQHVGDQALQHEYESPQPADCLLRPEEKPMPALRKHLERQAMMLVGAIRDTQSDFDLKLTPENVQAQLERYIFNPDLDRLSKEQTEVRFNFYPPFLLPKAICNYHIFSITVPIPRSCRANRYGTKLWQKVRQISRFERLPRWQPDVPIDEGLGTEVTPVAELEEEIKLTPLANDPPRLQWAKMRGEHILHFSYPSLHLPPKISRMLIENLLRPFTQECRTGKGPDTDEEDWTEPCLSDEELAHILDPQRKLNPIELARQLEQRRTMVAMAINYCCTLELMERFFREPSMVRKMQEVLHHTFHHGFVQTIRDVAKVNLSNYATYHGQTYISPLNNCMLAKLMEGDEREDYVVDSVYLALVTAWQTAMGMWQHAISETTIEAYTAVVQQHLRPLYALRSVSDMAKTIANILMDGDRLMEEMRKCMPNFTTLSQISAFRQFILERSNIPTHGAPFYPSDFVPLGYGQSKPILWDQVYLLRLAYYLTRHGGYLWEPESERGLAASYCPCNLCSPHRSPTENVALHNEILAIGTFEIRTSDDKSFTLTPELWTNAFLDRFVAQDFHPFQVLHYRNEPDSFSDSLQACVTRTPEVLMLIRQIQSAREEFLLTKGKGVYKDPTTGEVISGAKEDSQHPGAPAGKPLGPSTPAPSALPAARSYLSGRDPEEAATTEPLPPAYRHGPANDGSKSARHRKLLTRSSSTSALPSQESRQNQSALAAGGQYFGSHASGPSRTGAGNGPNAALQPPRGRRRRRVPRKPGFRFPVGDLGGGIGGPDGQGESASGGRGLSPNASQTAPAIPAKGQSQGFNIPRSTALKILSRGKDAYQSSA